jgi:hypothetical protein
MSQDAVEYAQIPGKKASLEAKMHEDGRFFGQIRKCQLSTSIRGSSGLGWLRY